jgi:hypothetical protein
LDDNWAIFCTIWILYKSKNNKAFKCKALFPFCHFIVTCTTYQCGAQVINHSWTITCALHTSLFMICFEICLQFPPFDWLFTMIYLWRKVGRMLQILFLVFGKLLTRKGAWACLPHVWTCGTKVLEYWMISSFKIKLNCNWKFWKTWNVPLVLLERSWWAGFNGIYLARFIFGMWEKLI